MFSGLQYCKVKLLLRLPFSGCCCTSMEQSTTLHILSELHKLSILSTDNSRHFCSQNLFQNTHSHPYIIPIFISWSSTGFSQFTMWIMSQWCDLIWWNGINLNLNRGHSLLAEMLNDVEDINGFRLLRLIEEHVERDECPRATDPGATVNQESRMRTNCASTVNDLRWET